MKKSFLCMLVLLITTTIAFSQQSFDSANHDTVTPIVKYKYRNNWYHKVDSYHNVRLEENIVIS